MALSQNVLKIGSKDDKDPYCLFTLKLAQDERYKLKMQQDLLTTDLAEFSKMLIEHLEMCHMDSNTMTPKFMLELLLESSTKALMIMEINQWQSLSQIILSFLQDSDSIFRDYLAVSHKKLKKREKELTKMIRD